MSALWQGNDGLMNPLQSLPFSTLVALVSARLLPDTTVLCQIYSVMQRIE
jgi:hypothetical protein